MASPVIQFKRGALANLPGLRAGEPGWTTDSFDLYVGINSTTGGNKIVGSGSSSMYTWINFIRLGDT